MKKYIYHGKNSDPIDHNNDIEIKTKKTSAFICSIITFVLKRRHSKR